MGLVSFVGRVLYWSIAVYIVLLIINRMVSGRNAWDKHVMEYKHYPVLVAHRGGRGIYPENTIEAFRISHYRYHADLLESDVQMTKDHKFILLHNLYLDETTNMTGMVRDYTLAELKQADAAYYFTEDQKTYPLRGKGITLTSLEEFLDEFYQQDVRISIELKDTTTESAEELMKVVERYPGLNKQVCIDCSNHPIQNFWRSKMGLKYCSENDEAEGILAGFFAKIRLSRLYFFLFPNKVEYFFAPYKSMKGFDFLTDRLFETLQNEMGVPFMYFTVNNEMEIARAISLGAKGVLTDRPDLAYKVFVALGLREDNANITKETEHYHVTSERDSWEFSTPTLRFVELLGGTLPDAAFAIFFLAIPMTILVIVYDILRFFFLVLSWIRRIFCCGKKKKD